MFRSLTNRTARIFVHPRCVCDAPAEPADEPTLVQMYGIAKLNIPITADDRAVIRAWAHKFYRTFSGFGFKTTVRACALSLRCGCMCLRPWLVTCTGAQCRGFSAHRSSMCDWTRFTGSSTELPAFVCLTGLPVTW